MDGWVVGFPEGWDEGFDVGCLDGVPLGCAVGSEDGWLLGLVDGCEGTADGSIVGSVCSFLRFNAEFDEESTRTILIAAYSRSSINKIFMCITI